VAQSDRRFRRVLSAGATSAAPAVRRGAIGSGEVVATARQASFGSDFRWANFEVTYCREASHEWRPHPWNFPRCCGFGLLPGLSQRSHSPPLRVWRPFCLSPQRQRVRTKMRACRRATPSAGTERRDLPRREAPAATWLLHLSQSKAGASSAYESPF
jgi:hypothetical protein